MDDSDRELVRSLTETVREQGAALYRTHGLLSAVHTRQELFIETHSACVNEMRERADGHSAMIQGTTLKIGKWEAQAKLIIGVASFVGAGGLASMVAVLFRLYR